MSRTKVAPRLREIVDDLDGHPDFLKSDHVICKRELRALLAVVRLSRRIVREDPRYREPIAHEIARSLSRLSLSTAPSATTRRK